MESIMAPAYQETSTTSGEIDCDSVEVALIATGVRNGSEHCTGAEDGIKHDSV